MTPRDEQHRTPDEQQALAALRGMQSPRASADARARARQAFLDAAASETTGSEPPPDAGAVARRRSGLWVVLPAAAMLAVAVFGIWQFASGPRALWRVTDVVLPAGIDGAPTEGFVLEPGRIATGPESELELQLGDQLRLRLLPGTVIELPEPPTRWGSGDMVLTLASGEVYGIGEDLDAPLRVIARHSETLVHGTTFAVFQTPDASRTCLWAGAVTITNRSDGSTHTLEPGQRFYVYADGSVSGPQPLDAMETMKLQMLHDRGLLPDPTDQR